MLIKYGVKGFKTFNEYVEINLTADNYISFNQDLIFEESNTLKSALIYGPNNTGKSCYIESLGLLKTIVEEGKINKDTVYNFFFNMFNKKKIIDFYIEFELKNNIYDYNLSLSDEQKIIDEKLFVNKNNIFLRNENNKDKVMKQVVDLIKIHEDTLVISTLPEKYIDYSKDFKMFFDSLSIIRYNGDYNEIINNYLSLNELEQKKFKNVIKNADVSIDDMKLSTDEVSVKYNALRLFSQYMMNDVKRSMPSVIADSDGTKTYMYYVLKIIKALRSGGVIVIDEIDSSLHTLLTRSIISIFNNEDNHNIQLIATTHDLQLLDCKYLFRKDQIWLTYKDKMKVYLYSLNEFKANKDPQIRRANVIESYLKGMFGALPHPDVEDYIFDKDE